MPYEQMKEKLKKKKEGNSMLSDLEKNAKSSVLKDLSDQAGKAMAGKLASMKKVTVASPDKEGLKAGLEKAKELVGEMPQPGYDEPKKRPELEALEEDDSGIGTPAPESMEDMETGYEHMSAEELDEVIKELEALKAKKKA